MFRVGMEEAKRNTHLMYLSLRPISEQRREGGRVL